MITYIILVVMIVLAVNLQDKKKENENLKNKIKQLEQKIKTLTDSNSDTEYKPLSEPISNANIAEKSQVNETITNNDKIKNKSKDKNNEILVAGAIFIILAAIIFLTSTWRIIPNMIKTVILLALIVVFEGASKIAKNTFKLEQTSKTFHYLALAYIPICLLSISAFGIIGNYFSINGEGKFIYFAISSAIVAFVYYVDFYKNKFKLMYIFSLIMQTMCVIFSMRIFNAQFNSICLGILIHTLIILLISQDKITKEYSNIISLIMISHVSLRELFIMLFKDTSTTLIWSMIFLLTILIQYILYNRTNDENAQKGRALILGILAISFGYCIMLKQHCSYHFYVIYSMIIYLISILKITSNGYIEKALQNISYLAIGITVSFILMFEFRTFINDIAYFILLFIILVHSYINKQETSAKAVIRFFIAANIYILLYSTRELFNLEINAFYINAIATFILMGLEIIQKKYEQSTSPAIISVSQNIALLTLVCNTQLASDVLTFIVAITIYIVNNYIMKRNQFFNIIPLMWLFIKVNTIDEIYISREVLILSISTITTLLSFKQNKISVNTVSSFIYILASFLYIENSYISSIILLIWSIVNYIMIKTKPSKDIFMTLILTSLMRIYWLFATQIFTKYDSLKLIILPIYATALFSLVLDKYVKQNGLKYTAFSLIYLFAIFGYNSVLDGMIYTFALIGMIIYSYHKQLWPIFKISIIALIANGFLLTSVFWLSIPWWIYLLAIGTGLIGFAIHNENKKK